MAQAAGEQNNTGAAEEAAGIIEDMRTAIDAHNRSLPPLPLGAAPRSINATGVENTAWDQAKADR
ncbi:MAG: hypothetical protein H6799_00770 [Candidatus Nomurabacteria bacterium]|nr:MAG: hypothetical protein H6799_00770 [Candidatus Nomurabacteria bacterium]